MSSVLRVLVTHPHNDLYGSDKQLLESMYGLLDAGWQVTVAVPRNAPDVGFRARLHDLDVTIAGVDFPVLRKVAMRRPGSFARMSYDMARTKHLRTMIRQCRPDVLYVNTIVTPSWLLAGRLCRVPTICHVHEAEETMPRAPRTVLAAPLMLADHLIANSAATGAMLSSDLPPLASRVVTIPNGVEGPPRPLAALPRERPNRLRLLQIGRMAPRKGTDCAIEAAADMVARGHDVTLDIVGDVFPGYEAFESALRARAGAPDLAGRVFFHGYQPDVWGHLEQAHVVLVPSLVEPFGNVAVEAMAAGRPVVASRVGGLAEVVVDGVTGLHSTPGDSHDLAGQVERLWDEWDGTRRMATEALSRAQQFSVPEYRRRIVELMARSAR